jgi:hypothetical protein
MKLSPAKTTAFGLMLLFFLSIFSLSLRAASIQTGPSLTRHTFDTLDKVKKENRFEAVTSQYKKKYRHIPEAQAMSYLDQLSATAVDLNDKVL